MSFGFSISDCYLLAQGLWRLTALLKGEAVSGFKRYKDKYFQLARLAQYLHEVAEDNIERDDTTFSAELQKIRKLLGKFSSNIEELKPHLGRKRKRKSLLGAIKKIRWRVHSDKLAAIHEDLMYQINIMTIKNQFRSGIHNFGGICNPTLSHGFHFEDARGVVRMIDFVSISSWEDLHQFLLRVFPANDPGHKAIQHQRYLIHKTRPNMNVLCSSPSVKPFDEVVMRQDSIQMSIIFPYQESYEWQCPKCSNRRSAEFRGVALSCENCDLLLRFQDSHDNEPDPLTKIALDGLRSTGLRDFVEGFSTKTCQPERQPGTKNTKVDELDVKAWIRANSPDLEPFPPTPPRTKEPQIRHFSRVTICTPLWPDLSNHTSHREAMKNLLETMKGLKRRTQYLKSEDLPFAQVAAFLNSRFWDSRHDRSMLRFLESILQAHQRKQPLMKWSQKNIRLLRDYIRRTDEATAQFQTPALKIRCLLWIIWDVLQMEGEILRSSSNLLNHFAVRQGQKREKTPLALKLFTMPHILLLIPWRLTFDVIEDFAQLFAAEKPTYLFSAIRGLVMDTGAISLYFYLDGDLANYFLSHKDLDDDADSKFSPACQRWMNAVMQSRGLELEADHVIQHIWQLTHDGFS